MQVFEKSCKGICWHCGEPVPDDRFFHCSDDCQKQCKTYNYQPEDSGWFEEENLQKESAEEKRLSPKEQFIKNVEAVGELPHYRLAQAIPLCSHKYNCKEHREICMAKHGYKLITSLK